MGNVQVGTLYKKSIVRDMAGNIINMRDEAKGGWIVRNRQVVDKEAWDEYLRVEDDKRKAAQAQAIPLKERNDAEPPKPQADIKDKQIEDLKAQLAKAIEALNKK